MKSRFFFLLLLIGLSGLVYAQIAPKWVNPLMRDQSYPSGEYYVGFVSQSYQKGENTDQYAEKMKGAARAALSESIFVSIKSLSSSQMSSLNGSSEDRYQKSTVTSSSLEAIGMETEAYTDAKKRIVYAFAYAKKKSLIRHYYGLLSSELDRISSALERNEKIEDNTEAYKRYNSELNALNAAKEYQDMLKYLDVSSEVVLQIGKWKTLNDATLDAIDKLRNNKDISIKDASYFLVDKLKEELGDESSTIHMGLITYKSTGIPTEFSDYFGFLFRQALEEKRGGISRAIGLEGYVVSGSYWPGENEVQVIANINYVKDGEILQLKAGGSISLELEKVKRLNVVYDLDDPKLLEKNAQLRPTSPTGGLIANLTTQKGSQSVIFKEGELLSLSVSVSRPSYIRIINIWSDNQKFLLADNYYVSPEQTNQSVKLPLSWETSCPCGVEYIQMIAQDQPFSPIETENVDGFESIKGSLSSLIKKTRSIKSTSQYYAESALILTTIE
jgi:hypothetical protein